MAARTHTGMQTHISTRTSVQTHTHTYPTTQTSKAVNFGLGGDDVIEAMREGLLGWFGALRGGAGVKGHSRR